MLKAIIIEDNLDLSQLLDKIASGAGYEVDCIKQSKTFETAINWNNYDLILLDTGVSEFNDDAVMKMTLSTANICLMSVFKEDLIGKLTREVTYDYFLQKPFRLDPVIRILTLSKNSNNRLNYTHPLTSNNN